MSRPKPNILAEKINKDSCKTDQVIHSDGFWAIFYNGEPINLRSLNTMASYPGPKYKKVAFSNPGHAINLAKKLNLQFETDGFEVYLLTKGEKIYTKKTNN